MTAIPDRRRLRWPLLALAIGAFGIGTTEFSPMGLLPVIADGVDVSIPTAGLLVSAYAIGVMAGAPVMTLLFARFGKRTALMCLMAIFTTMPSRRCASLRANGRFSKSHHPTH